MRLTYKNFKIFTEQGSLISSNKLFRKVPVLNYTIFRKLVKNNNKVFSKSNLVVYTTSLPIIFLLKFYNIKIYNGRIFSNFVFNNLKKFKKVGQFINTRVMNFGKILHLRKKNLKKKK